MHIQMSTCVSFVIVVSIVLVLVFIMLPKAIRIVIIRVIITLE